MEEIIAKAKKLITDYGKNVANKNLAKILEAVCEDVSFQLPTGAILEGKKTIKTFYEDSFSDGSYEFDLEFTDEKVVSDLVFINGLIKKIFHPTGKQAEITTWDFFYILKRENGIWKIWQMRIA